MTESPERRIAQHRVAAGRHGVGVTHRWASPPLPRTAASAAERRLIDLCTQSYGAPVVGREQFASADFIAVRSAAAELIEHDNRPAVLL
jgi:hypothetical protein